MAKEARTWLKEKRLELGLTQQQVAEKANIERTSYTMVETGQRKPSVLVAQSIGKAMNFNWAIFFEEEGNDTKQKELVV